MAIGVLGHLRGGHSPVVQLTKHRLSQHQARESPLISVMSAIARVFDGLIGCEKSGVKWQKFYFVGIDYKPFTATSHKELPSGLLGPVVIRQEF